MRDNAPPKGQGNTCSTRFFAQAIARPSLSYYKPNTLAYQRPKTQATAYKNRHASAPSCSSISVTPRRPPAPRYHRQRSRRSPPRSRSRSDTTSSTHVVLPPPLAARQFVDPPPIRGPTGANLPINQSRGHPPRSYSLVSGLRIGTLRYERQDYRRFYLAHPSGRG